jgi:integrase/recombinase XerD
LPLRELLHILLGSKGRRQLELRQKTNRELFALYDGELAFHHNSTRGLHEAKRVLSHFHDHLGEYPPNPEMAKSFLSTFSNRKPTTLARYAAILKVFLKWYGEELDITLRVPKILPSYVEKQDIERLLEAIRDKRTHRATAPRDLLLVDLAIHTGLRRSELANLTVGDIDIERQLLVVRQGKGAKDRVIPLSTNMTNKLAIYTEEKPKDNSLFGLAPATISGKIKTFARKAGVDIHTHSLRDYFATSLSEKGATIREIQSLLGHTNLTHTERYTLHTDRHLKHAVELIDHETEEKRTTPESGKSSDSKNSWYELPRLQPIVTLKVVCKATTANLDDVLRDDYFSHFLVRNEGDGPAIEIEMALLDNKLDWLDTYRETTLRVGGQLIFKPMLHRPEGNYYMLCQYKQISPHDDDENWAQTWLPFRLSKASGQGEVYVAPGELQLKFRISRKEKIDIFSSKPK